MADLAREVFDTATRRVERQERIEAGAQSALDMYLRISRCECAGFCLRCRELVDRIGQILSSALT